MSILLAFLLLASPESKQVIVNPSEVKWTHDKDGPPEAESALVRADETTHGLELLVRYEGGHVFKPHWHTSNERMILFEGRLSINGKMLEPGGVAYLPARELQTLVCVSKTRCSFYIQWDGDPKSQPPPVQ